MADMLRNWLLKEGLKSLWSVIIALMSVGGICGSFSINVISAKIGRKRGLYVSIGLNALGSALAIISYYVRVYFDSFWLFFLTSKFKL